MIKLKGMHDSMIRCMIPDNMDASEITEQMKKIVKDGKTVLPGSKLVLDFGARKLTSELVSAMLSGFVWSSGAAVAAWITLDAASQDALARAGLPSTEPSAKQKKSAAPGRMVFRSLRSGQRVTHGGDVIIAGNVNSGAEVFAAGNVTVLGRLRGLVHAGCNGLDTAAIAARSMEAVQVRIGTHVGSLERSALWWGKSVIAKVEDDTVLIDYWPSLKSEHAPEINF